jgi:hypothetical protein
MPLRPACRTHSATYIITPVSRALLDHGPESGKPSRERRVVGQALRRPGWLSHPLPRKGRGTRCGRCLSRAAADESSPALQCRGKYRITIQSPVGTDEVLRSVVPPGLGIILAAYPALKCWAIFMRSLRDRAWQPGGAGRERGRKTAPARVARGKECSPRRKPWVRSANEPSPRQRAKECGGRTAFRIRRGSAGLSPAEWATKNDGCSP